MQSMAGFATVEVVPATACVAVAEPAAGVAVSYLILVALAGISAGLRQRRTRRLPIAGAAALLMLLALAPGAAAAPLTFSNVLAVQLSPDDPTTSITTDLFATPDAILTNGTHVSFFIDIAGALPEGGSDTLRLSYAQAGTVLAVQEFAIPVFGSVTPPFTLVTGLEFPVLYRPVPFSLTVDLLGSDPDFVIPGGPLVGRPVDSYSYTFSVVQPVPEPASLILLGTGCLAAAGRRCWRRRGLRRPANRVDASPVQR